MTRSSRQSETTVGFGEADYGPLLDELTTIAGAAIAAAAVRVCTQLPQDLQVYEGQLSRHLVWICEAAVGPVPPSEESGAIITLRRRLIGAIRSELLQRWAKEPPASAEMLDVLQRLERAHAACTPQIDQVFGTELADRGGLDLVVEVAHDMRSPLTSILFLSEILHRNAGGTFTDVQKRQIGIIYSAALGLVGLASDMIEMARGGSRLRAPDPAPFSVNEVLRGVYDLVRPTAEEKKLDVYVGLLEAEHRMGHSIPLSRVLLNLTTNALKFTHSGSVMVCAVPAGGARVIFSVQDTGPGMGPEAMSTLYQPFRREPARESGYCFSGTGLGLAICKRLVDALGSELQVESTPGAGTRFFFEIELPPASSL